MTFKPIKTRKIYVEIIDQIKAFITSGNLKPGDKLSSERELAEQLQVSRASVREALSALEMTGLIETKPGGGTFIREIHFDTTFEPLALLLMAQQDDIEELLELRKVLEVEAAALTAERATPEEVLEMAHTIEEMEGDLEHGRLGEEADFHLHLLIARGTKNSILVKLMNTIADALQHNIKTNRGLLYRDPHIPAELLEEHRAIYQAIAKKDSEAARQAMYQHLEGVAQRFMTMTN